MNEVTERLRTAIADRYRIERHLGEGGMATVYLAHDLKHDRKVAVKVLRPELAAILGGERFLNEIRVTANLQHPNILPLYDSGAADGFLYYVMPHVEGESLRQKMEREQQLGVDDTVEIAKGVAAALQYAHEHGIVHRDIKPENILLQSGQPLVADFGIALAVSHAGGTRLTETGMSLGTPHYMSPEQATGDRELDARSDIYSLGAMVYEMLVGEPPHLGKSVQAIIAKILSERPVPISQSRDMVPPNVDAAVLRALAKSPADRFHSAAEFTAALVNPTFTLPSTQAATAGTPTDRSRRSRWERLGPLSAGVALVALVAAAWGWTRPAPERATTRVSVYLPDGQTLDGSATFDLAPDGSFMVYEGPDEDVPRLWMRPWDALGATPIRDTEGARQPAISPSGAEVAFLRSTSIRIVPLGGGVSRSVAEGVVQCCVRWSADGSWLYFHHLERGIGRVPASGGPAELVAPVDSRANMWLEPLPGDDLVLVEVTDATTGPGIAALHTGSGAVTPLTAGQFPRYAEGHLLFVTPDGTTLMTVPLDPRGPALRGSPVPVGEGLLRPLGGWSYFAASRSGRLLYSVGRRESAVYEIAWIGRDGQLTPVDPEWRLDPGDNNRGLSLSPDGTRLAVTKLEDGNYDIWVKQLPRGPASRLTFDPAQDVRPRWTPDGQRVTFMSDRGGIAAVYIKRVTGTGREEILLASDQRAYWEALYSPDQAWLVARSGGTLTLPGNRDVWLLGADADSATPLIVTDFDEKAIALSPDARWLAYESDETGRNEIYVRPFPTVDDGKWQVSTGGGVMPRWAHGGRELFFIDAGGQLVAAEVQAGETFAVGARRPLFKLSNDILFRQDEQYALYDVAPDDRRFIMFRAVEQRESRSELILVDNWLADVTRRGGR